MFLKCLQRTPEYELSAYLENDKAVFKVSHSKNGMGDLQIVFVSHSYPSANLFFKEQVAKEKS